MKEDRRPTKWWIEPLAAGIVFYVNTFFVFFLCGEPITMKMLLWGIPISGVCGLMYRPIVNFFGKLETGIKKQGLKK